MPDQAPSSESAQAGLTPCRNHVNVVLMEELSLPRNITPAFPVLAFVVHGVWMLWVTAPDSIDNTSERAVSG